MKKIFSFVIALTLSIGLTKGQTAWINYKIDAKLSVKVPAEPSKLDENSQFVKTADSSIYIIAKIDMEKLANLDSASVATQSPTAEFANSFKTGMLGQMPGSSLGDVAIGQWHGYTCYHLDGDNKGKNLKIYAYMVFIGAKIYSLMAIFPATKTLAGKDFYFNSLTLN